MHSSPVFEPLPHTPFKWGSKQRRYQSLKPQTQYVSKKIARKALQIPSIDLSNLSQTCSIRVSKSPEIKQTRKEDEEEEEEAEKVRIAVSGLLMLASQDPWDIKKKLTESDVNLQQSRLLISKSLVKQHIIPRLNANRKKAIETEDGLAVGVRDCDTGDVFELRFKWRQSTKSYVVDGGWTRDFVKRRNLDKNDEIGLFWSPIQNMFIFTVLHRASRSVLRVT